MQFLKPSPTAATAADMPVSHTRGGVTNRMYHQEPVSRLLQKLLQPAAPSWHCAHTAVGSCQRAAAAATGHSTACCSTARHNCCCCRRHALPVLLCAAVRVVLMPPGRRQWRTRTSRWAAACGPSAGGNSRAGGEQMQHQGQERREQHAQTYNSFENKSN